MNDYENNQEVYQNYYQPIVNEIATQGSEKKKRRPIIRNVATVVCCLALMLGSGIAGAKITEGRFNAEPRISKTVQIGTETAQAQQPFTDTFDADARSDDSVSALGRINPSGETLTLTELFKGADPAVVAISTETTTRNAFGRTVTLPAAGSGFVISEDGYIVTNNHVIDNASRISVLLHDGTRYPAVLVGRDPISDLAVLKIEAKNLAYLTWGDSDTLQVGEQVAAIGNPLGEFANSMTVGYISALDREINIDGTPRIMLQTDAAVNSGNSGGPLLNLRGQVIGIVSAKSSGVSVEGLGFAIPSNRASRVISQLIEDGYVKGRAVMGVQVTTMQEDDNKTSVYVNSVNAGSAAERAGIKDGDIIRSANGSIVTTVAELKAIIDALSPGDRLGLVISRGDEEISLTVILDEYIPPEMPDPIRSTDLDPDLPDGDAGLPFDPRSLFPGFEDMFP